MKRIIALILAMLMVIPFAFSCTNTGDGGEVTTTVQGDGTSSDAVGGEVDDDPSSPYVEDELGDNLNFGTTISILYWEDVERPEFEVEDITGDAVNDALYNRNVTVETRLGVDLRWVPTKGNFNNQKNFVEQCANGNVDGAYDIFAGYSMTAATIAMQGYSQDILSLDYIDLEKPWWPDSLLSQATINDKLYFISGDISTMMLHMMYVVLFNKQLLSDFNLEADNPYDLVQSNKWTISKMLTMSEKLYGDIGDVEGEKDIGDRFGFVTNDINLDGFYTGAGLKTVEKGENGLIISPDFSSTKAESLASQLVDFFAENYALAKKATGFSPATIFAQNRALFTMDRAYITTCPAMLAVGDAVDFGVVPCPKYNNKQETYVTMLGFPFTMYSVSSASKNPDIAAATLECLGSEGYRQVTPQLFETVMKVRYVRDEVSSDMYDLIKSCVYIDIGRIFTTEFNNLTYKIFRETVRDLKSNYLQVYAQNEQLLIGPSGYLAKINEKFYGN